MAGSQFRYRIGQRVWWQPEVYGVVYPRKRVKIIDRTIEPALGKTYRIRYQNGKSGGFVREAQLSE